MFNKSEYQKKYYEKHKERIQEQNRKRRKKNGEYRSKNLKTFINSDIISPFDFKKNLLNLKYKILIHEKIWNSIEAGKTYMFKIGIYGKYDRVTMKKIKGTVISKTENIIIIQNTENKKYTFTKNDFLTNLFTVNLKSKGA